jgi:lysophospholipase
MRLAAVVLVALGCALLSQPSQAVPEDELLDRLAELKTFYAQGESGFFQHPEGLKVHYRVFRHPEERLRLVVLPGRTEPVRKYDELSYDLFQHGISLFLLDWPGQGRSDRYLADSTKGHVEDYESYLQALEIFMADVVGEASARPVVALAHSMGANVLSLYLVEHPRGFNRAVISSPMLDIPSYGMPDRMAWGLLKLWEWLGRGESYVFTHGPYDEAEPNYVSSSEVRWSREQRRKKHYPELLIAGATMSWVRASYEATWQMRRDAEKLMIPLLMLQAGEDVIVETEGQDHVCRHAQNCRKVEFPTAGHEILQETDPIRDRALQHIFEFLNQIES